MAQAFDKNTSLDDEMSPWIGEHVAVHGSYCSLVLKGCCGGHHDQNVLYQDTHYTVLCHRLSFDKAEQYGYGDVL